MPVFYFDRTIEMGVSTKEIGLPAIHLDQHVVRHTRQEPASGIVVRLFVLEDKCTATRREPTQRPLSPSSLEGAWPWLRSFGRCQRTRISSASR